MIFQPFPILETQNLSLIELSYSHIDDLFKIRNDQRMHEFTDTKPDDSIEDTRKYITKMMDGLHDNKWIIWAIMHKTSQKIIGSISLWNFTNNSAELGYGIHPAYQGRGYMKETLTEVIKYGLYGLGLSYIDAYTEISNHQSIGLLEKCGFIFINTTIDKGYLNNRDYQLKCYRTQKMEN